MAWYGQGILTIKTGVSSQRSLELMSLCEYKVRMWAIMGLMMFLHVIVFHLGKRIWKYRKRKISKPIRIHGTDILAYIN